MAEENIVENFEHVETPKDLALELYERASEETKEGIRSMAESKGGSIAATVTVILGTAYNDFTKRQILENVLPTVSLFEWATERGLDRICHDIAQRAEAS